MVQAVAVAAALADHPDDPAARAQAYEAASEREVEPSYAFAVQMDRLGADPAGGAGGETPAGRAMGALLVAGGDRPGDRAGG